LQGMDDINEVREGRIPVIKLWGILLVPLQGDISDQQMSALSNTVLDEIRKGDTLGVAIDLSGLWMVDSHLCAAFANLAAAAKYMGARTLLCGMSPDIAMTLQSMDIELQGVPTTLTLEHAMADLGLRPPKSRLSRHIHGESMRLADQMLARSSAECQGQGDDT
jgi:rsbT antagonist protein RsbS